MEYVIAEVICMFLLSFYSNMNAGQAMQERDTHTQTQQKSL